jgi:hypothetical protein
MRLQELLDPEGWLLKQPINEMAGLPSKTTGLPYFLWIGKVGGQHGPRVKVSNKKGAFDENDNFVVSVGKPAEVLTPKSVNIKSTELEQVLDWVTLNYDELMALYNMYETGTGDVVQLLSALKKI